MTLTDDSIKAFFENWHSKQDALGQSRDKAAWTELMVSQTLAYAAWCFFEHSQRLDTFVLVHGANSCFGSYATLQTETMTDDFEAMRPSGNPMSRALYIDMFSNGDVTEFTNKLVEIKSICYICDGKAAVVVFVQDQIFKYKGTPNEGTCGCPL